MANSTGLVDSSLSYVYHALVPVGIARHVLIGARREENQILFALWCWFSRLVCLPATDNTDLYAGVVIMEI